MRSGRQSEPRAIELQPPLDAARSDFTLSTEAANTLGATYLKDVEGKSIWVGYSTRYFLEQYSYSGDKITEIARTETWFPPMTDVRRNRAAYDTVSGIKDFAVETNGWIAVLILRHLDVQRTLAAAKSRGHENDAKTRPTMVFDNVLHVIDPATGRTIAERVVRDTMFMGFADKVHAYASRKLDDGTPLLDVYRFSVVNPNTMEGCK